MDYTSPSSLAENTAAISGTFHADRETYDQFYHLHRDTLSGFPGVWNYLARASEIFTEAETPGCWDSGEWIETVDVYVEFIISADIRKLPNEKALRAKMRKLMRRVISAAKIPTPPKTKTSPINPTKRRIPLLMKKALINNNDSKRLLVQQRAEPPKIRRRQGVFTVKLCSVGNPDFRQDPNRPLPGVPSALAHVETLIEARDLCQHFIAYYDLGGGNWNGGEVVRTSDGLVIGRFSYNGCLWPDGPWTEETKEITIE